MIVTSHRTVNGQEGFRMLKLFPTTATNDLSVLFHFRRNPGKLFLLHEAHSDVDESSERRGDTTFFVAL